MYLSFISLGLPDSLLGVSWPAIRAEWILPLDAAGIVALISTVSTILSSFMSGHIIKRLGTGKVVLISCLMTGSALLGISLAPSFLWLVIFSIPLGLGAGSVDTALNNYVALYYKSHHMNWLHSFWGVGATLGPVIMSQALILSSWRSGYRYISILQLILAAILFLSLPLWKKHRELVKNTPITDEHPSFLKNQGMQVHKIKGLPYALATFLLYCSVEFSVGLWGSSYLIQSRQIAIEEAAAWIAMYYGGITIGRFIAGFISLKLNNSQMIRSGSLIVLAGTLLILFSTANTILMFSFVLVGLGLSPIFPAMIHETPKRFGSQHSEVIIGYQMAFAYIGIALLPPLLGVAIKNISIQVFPYFLVVFIALMFICTERLRILTQD
jgi:fucose permease